MNTTCPYCGVGCGLIAGLDGLRGDPTHPANAGRLCVKGKNLAQTLDDRERLITPTLAGRPVGWSEALDAAARHFSSAITEHGPDSVAFYVSGQFLTEDYYVANKLMKGFIGSGNIDTNSRLCMASPVAAHQRAFGDDLVPGIYADFEEAGLILFVGSNAAWCHPVLFQRALQAREQRGSTIVVIDPRRTATADLADWHIPIEPNGDLALFLALLDDCAQHDALDADFINTHTEHFSATLAAARNAQPGIDPASFARLAALVRRTPRMVTAFSQGVNQSTQATDSINAIINLHLATGRIGKPGTGPFSLTGQPNAMGGRDVGGLATQLAAHLLFDNPTQHDLLRRFWSAPNLATKPGLKAVDLFEAVHDGKIKALWIAGTNPAESLPRSLHVRAALERCPAVIVADCWPTATTARASIVLPAAGWSEKDGTVTNSERVISRQRAFRVAPGLAKPDWWMFTELAKRLGHGSAFTYPNPAAIFREHAALSAFENQGDRPFNLAPLDRLSDEDYDAIRPCRWPLTPTDGRLFTDGHFPTPSGKARFVPLSPPAPAASRLGFTLNTGRLRDQWHSMTRTGRVAELMAHQPAARLDIAPADAAQLGITNNDLLTLHSAEGKLTLPVSIDPGQRPGSLFAAIHWTAQQGSGGSINRLTSAARDPHSGEPAFKHTEITLEPTRIAWHGIALMRAALMRTGHRPPISETDPILWSATPCAAALTLVSLTGLEPLPASLSSRALLNRLFALRDDAELIDYADAKRGLYRIAVRAQHRLELLLHIAPPNVALPPIAALEAQFNQVTQPNGQPNAQPNAQPTARSLLLGQPNLARPHGRIICVCHQLTEPSLRAAIATAKLRSIAEIGAATKAGTGCGSCVADLKGLLHHDPIAAE